MVFSVERPSKEGSPLGWGIELCGSSSCLAGLRSLLNTEGILTLPMFLLSDGSLIQMWSASFAWWCRVLLSLSIIVKSLSSAFGCFVEMQWFLMALVVWFLWSELFLSGTCWFHLCILLCSCWLGISSGRTYHVNTYLSAPNQIMFVFRRLTTQTKKCTKFYTVVTVTKIKHQQVAATTW